MSNIQFYESLLAFKTPKSGTYFAEIGIENTKSGVLNAKWWRLKYQYWSLSFMKCTPNPSNTNRKHENPPKHKV